MSETSRVVSATRPSSGGTYRRLCLVTCIVVTCMAIFPGSSIAHGRKRFALSCGSRLVNSMRYMCLQEVWTPKLCSVFRTKFCGTEINFHPICRFTCITESRISDRQDIAITTSASPQRVVSPYPHNNTNDVTTPSPNASHVFRSLRSSKKLSKHTRRTKRFIAKRCCSEICSIIVLRQFCLGDET
uniref:Insulin-like 3 protein n=1 Tax=Ciona intestinalis TaxID=7719 RepID=H2XNM7_CIOIN|nr:insulin-like 3 protein isoform 1 [Ciona intestinalis]|eukprot:NP_001123344.2 insulin-like 3 protein isoform 1 [Ciona intestinalis]